MAGLMSAHTRSRIAPAVSKPPMGSTVTTASQEVTRTLRGGVKARAKDRARWATSATPSRVLARHWGITASAARHRRIGTTGNDVASVLALIADPAVEAGPIVAAVLSAYEERFLFAPTEDLRARLAHLKNEAEHLLEARQNRALQLNTTDRTNALRDHAAALIEIATLEEILH